MSESYAIRITARADRDLQRLPEKIATACVEFTFGALAEDPYRVGKPLRDELDGMHSARRGDYRVVYATVDAASTVDIVHIGRRSDVYRITTAEGGLRDALQAHQSGARALSQLSAKCCAVTDHPRVGQVVGDAVKNAAPAGSASRMAAE